MAPYIEYAFLYSYCYYYFYYYYFYYDKETCSGSTRG